MMAFKTYCAVSIGEDSRTGVLLSSMFVHPWTSNVEASVTANLFHMDSICLKDRMVRHYRSAIDTLVPAFCIKVHFKRSSQGVQGSRQLRVPRQHSALVGQTVHELLGLVVMPIR